MRMSADGIAQPTEDQTRLATAVVIERLSAGRETALRISGQSMSPYLIPGQTVLIEPCDARSLRPGHLVAFEREGRIVLHRVLSVNAVTGKVIEKGDNERAGSELESGQVLGRAVAIVATRRRSLIRGRDARMGAALAHLSSVHAHMCQCCQGFGVAGRIAAKGASLLFRVAITLGKPPR